MGIVFFKKETLLFLLLFFAIFLKFLNTNLPIYFSNYLIIFIIIITLIYIYSKSINVDFIFTDLDLLVLILFIYVKLNYIFLTEFTFSNHFILMDYFIFFHLIFKFNFDFFYFLFLFFSIKECIIFLFQYYGLITNINDQFIAYGSFGNPSNFSMIVGMAIIFLLRTTRIEGKFLEKSLLLFFVYCVILAQSRSVVLALILCILFKYWSNIREGFLKYYSKKSRHFIRWVIVIILPFFLYLLVNYKEVSAINRIYIWLISLKILFSNFFFGIGIGNFSRYFNDYISDCKELCFYGFKIPYSNENIFFTFNDLLEFFVETGLFGILIILIGVFYIIKFHKTSDKINFMILVYFAIISFFYYCFQQLHLLFIFSFALSNIRIESVLNIKIYRWVLFIVFMYLMTIFINYSQLQKNEYHLRNRIENENLSISDTSFIKEDFNLYYSLSANLAERNQIDDAITSLLTLENKLKLYQTKIQLSNLFLLNNDTSNAIRVLREALCLNKKAILPYYNLMEFYRNINKDSAYRYAKIVVEKVPKKNNTLYKEMKKNANEVLSSTK